MKPNKTRLRKWVAALRSRKWRQTTGSLGVEGENLRCCLGVACEAAPKKLRTTWRLDDSLMSAGVAAWYGCDNDPWLRHGPRTKDESRATGLNDSKGWSFARIARAIERTFDL